MCVFNFSSTGTLPVRVSHSRLGPYVMYGAQNRTAKSGCATWTVRWMNNRFHFARLAHAPRCAALAMSLLLAAVTSRISVTSLHAADEKAGQNLIGQSQEEADRKSTGCISCHTQTDEPTMHATGTLRLGCTDCHGGNADARISPGVAST